MTGSNPSPASRLGRRFALLLVLAALASAAPVRFDGGADGLRLEPAAAFAKSGKGKEGDRDDDDDDRDDDRDDDDRDDDRDDEREDRRDDREDEREDREDDLEDAREDREDALEDREDDDRSGRRDPQRDPGPAGTSGPVVRIELTSTGINVIYSDGSREIVSNGVYRREDASGRVLERRTATGADLVRLRALAGGRVAPAKAAAAPDPEPAAQGHPKKIRLRGNDVIVEYTNGWTEMVERGRYRLTDRYGHVAVDRAATEGDRRRLLAMAGR